MKLYTIFHCNLNYSSIEEESRPRVIQDCYYPLLDMVREAQVPTGIEASGYTLEVLAGMSSWVEKLKDLIKEGLVEFVGSGYQQIVGPLVPARVVAENLRAGQRVYGELLDLRPKLALLGEQAYWPGCVKLYKGAGYQGIVVHSVGGRHAVMARGIGNETIPCLFACDRMNEVFRKYAWSPPFAEPGVERRLLRPILSCANQREILSLYSGDTEVIGFRPRRIGRVGDSEWGRVSSLLSHLLSDDEPYKNISITLPSQALDEYTQGLYSGLSDFCVESEDNPTPIKNNYKLDRWRVGGRDNVGINERCMDIYKKLMSHGDYDAPGAGSVLLRAAWRELCYLYGSDFRTYITEKRWEKYLKRLREMEEAWLG